MFKRFWEPEDFWSSGESKGRELFWDFLKNFSLASGFLLIVVGLDGHAWQAFVADPLASSHPYAVQPRCRGRSASCRTPSDMLAKLTGKDDDKSGPKPSIPYWHLWTDEKGVSHQAQCALTEFELKGVGGADPQWNNKHETLILRPWW